MSIQILNIKLQRTDPSVSWGFNIQGGKDFHSPFIIHKVIANSLADQSSVRQGDYILRIGNNIVENLTHAQGREAIIAQGNHLELTLQRGSAPRSEDYNFNFAFPQHRLMNPDNIERVPVASPQIGLQLKNNKALLTQSYNSPMGLYSNQNISETMTTALKNSESQILKKSPLSDSTFSLSSSSLLSNSFSPSSSISQSSYLSQKPPLPNLNSLPKPFRRAETIEPYKLESIKIIENKENQTFKAIPVDNVILRSKSVSLDENRNVVYSKRNSITNGRELLKEIESSLKDEPGKNLLINEEKKPELICSRPVYRRTSWTPTKNEINNQLSNIKLEDPNRSSQAQSKSFKLLQATLDNGLSENEITFYDKIRQKTEVRRCSIDATNKTNNNNNNNNNNTPLRRLSKLVDPNSFEEKTDESNGVSRNFRSQSVKNDFLRASAILSHSSYLSNMKPTSSNTFNSNQRRYSTNMYRYGSNFKPLY